MDCLSDSDPEAFMQVLVEYQQRLQQAIARVRPSTLLPQGLPAMPSLPSVSSLSQLPAFRDLNAMTSFDDLGSAEHTNGTLHKPHEPQAERKDRQPAMPGLRDLSKQWAFQDLQEMSTFEDLGDTSESVSLREWARSTLASAYSNLPDLRTIGSSAASSMAASAAAARGALQSALPLVNMPEWPLARGSNGLNGLEGTLQAWRDRVSAASSALVQQAEHDGVFVRPCSLAFLACVSCAYTVAAAVLTSMLFHAACFIYSRLAASSKAYKAHFCLTACLCCRAQCRL